jgi:hypothetical protein
LASQSHLFLADKSYSDPSLLSARVDRSREREKERERERKRETEGERERERG